MAKSLRGPWLTLLALLGAWIPVGRRAAAYSHVESEATRDMHLQRYYRVDRFYKWYLVQEELVKGAEAKAALKPGPDGANVDLLLLGDSITEALMGKRLGKDAQALAGHRATFQEETAGLETLVLAIAGDMVHHLFQRVTQRRELPAGLVPRVISILIGTNDFVNVVTRSATGNPAPRDSVGNIVDNIFTLVKFLRLTFPETHILVQSIMPREDRSGDATAFVDKMNKTIKKQYFLMTEEGLSNVEIIDCSGVFLPADGDGQPVHLSDGLHPDAEGTRQWLRECVVGPARAYLAGRGAR